MEQRASSSSSPYLAEVRRTPVHAFSKFGVRPKELIKQGSDATENACTVARRRIIFFCHGLLANSDDRRSLHRSNSTASAFSVTFRFSYRPSMAVTCCPFFTVIDESAVRSFPSMTAAVSSENRYNAGDTISVL